MVDIVEYQAGQFYFNEVPDAVKLKRAWREGKRNFRGKLDEDGAGSGRSYCKPLAFFMEIAEQFPRCPAAGRIAGKKEGEKGNWGGRERRRCKKG